MELPNERKNQHDGPLVGLLQINILSEETYFEGKMRFFQKLDGLTNSKLHFCFDTNILILCISENKMKICILSA